MPTTLSPSARTLLTEWRRTDRAFFRRHARDERTMAIVAALAETLASYDAGASFSAVFSR